jgi:hypothetical protein
MMSLGDKMRLCFDMCQPKADNFTKNDHVACSSNDDLHVYVSVVSQDTRVPAYRIARPETLLDARRILLLLGSGPSTQRSTDAGARAPNGYRRDSDA